MVRFMSVESLEDTSETLKNFLVKKLLLPIPALKIKTPYNFGLDMPLF